MLNIWYKLFTEIEPNEIRKAMTDYEGLMDEVIKEVINEEKEAFELNDESLFKHYYIGYCDRFPL